MNTLPSEIMNLIFLQKASSIRVIRALSLVSKKFRKVAKPIDDGLTNIVKTHYEDLKNHELTIGITITKDKRYGQVLRKQEPDRVYVRKGKTITIRYPWVLYDVDFLLNVQTFVKII